MTNLDSRQPNKVPIAIGKMTKEQIEAEIIKGIESAKERTYSLDEVEKMLKAEFGI